MQYSKLGTHPTWRSIHSILNYLSQKEFEKYIHFCIMNSIMQMLYFMSTWVIWSRYSILELSFPFLKIQRFIGLPLHHRSTMTHWRFALCCKWARENRGCFRFQKSRFWRLLFFESRGLDPGRLACLGVEVVGVAGDRIDRGLPGTLVTISDLFRKGLFGFLPRSLEHLFGFVG